MTPGVHHGIAEMRKVWRDFLSPWEDLRIVVEEYRPLGDDRILVILHNSGRGKRSGMEIEPAAARTANLLEMRHGKVIRIPAWWDRDTALAELGLA